MRFPNCLALTAPKGYSYEAVEIAKKQMGGMPELLEQFYLRFGCSDELNHLQDFFRRIRAACLLNCGVAPQDPETDEPETM
ncbi:hypothetical protein FACS189475_06540 [Betaproteobacteria bacterium]|nr:hypothetical protein FACS189475_06540 [Betaproteobacteria bacterium]